MDANTLDSSENKTRKIKKKKKKSSEKQVLRDTPNPTDWEVTGIISLSFFFFKELPVCTKHCDSDLLVVLQAKNSIFLSLV